MSSIEKAAEAVARAQSEWSGGPDNDWTEVIARAVIDSLAQDTISDETIREIVTSHDRGSVPEAIDDIRDLFAPLSAQIALLDVEVGRMEARAEAAEAEAATADARIAELEAELEGWQAWQAPSWQERAAEAEHVVFQWKARAEAAEAKVERVRYVEGNWISSDNIGLNVEVVLRSSLRAALDGDAE